MKMPRLGPSRVAGLLGSLPLQRLAVVSLFACAGLLAFSRIQDFDFFWHLANGRAMLQEGRIVEEELFSYTRPGVPFSNHAWLAQMVFYAVYRAGGPLGFVAFKAGLVLLLTWLLYRTARFSGAAPILSGVLAVLAIVQGLERYRDRPELFSLLFVGLLGFLFTGATAGGIPRRALYAIPAVLVVWDLLHGAVYGYVYLAAFAAGLALERTLRPRAPGEGADPELLRTVAVVVALSLAAGLLNPYGFRRYDFFLEFLRPNAMVASTEEFAPPSLGLYPLFWIALVALVVLAAAFLRGAHLSRIVPVVPFIALAMRYRRAIGVFGLAAVPADATFTAAAARKLPERWRAALGYAAVFAIVGYTGFIKFAAPDNPYSFGHEVNPLLQPVATTRFIAQSGLAGNMYNPGHFGGYLAYHLSPQRKIFLYNNHVVWRDFPTVAQAPQLLDAYGIQYAVLERYWGDSAAYPSIFTPDRWALVYWDRASLLVVRDSPENAELLAANRLRLFTPALLDALERYEADPAVAAALAREIASWLRFSEHRRAADYLGYLLLRHAARIPDAAALAWMDAALPVNGSSAYLWFTESRFRLRAGEPDRARAALDRAAAIDADLVAKLTGAAR